MAPVPVSVPAFTVLFSVAGMTFLSDGWELLDKTNPFLPKLVFINFFLHQQETKQDINQMSFTRKKFIKFIKKFNKEKNCF